MISLGNGGAFPEIHFLQYPLDMGLHVTSIAVKQHRSLAATTGPEAALITTPPPGSSHSGASSTSLVIHQNASSALDPKRYAVAALQKPPEEDVAASLAATQRMVDERLKELGHGQKGEASVDPQLDPFARKMVAKQPKVVPGQLTIVAADASSDPSAVIRSPPKKRTTADDELASVPMCISGWKNPKNLVIPLELRQEADTTNRDKPAMSNAHIKLAMALQEKHKEQEQVKQERERAEREESDRRQSELEAEAAAKALEQLAHHRAEQLRLSKNETREDRQERRRLEREQRQREKEEEHRQRRLRVAAERIGTTVEELEGSHALMEALNSAQHPSDPHQSHDSRLSNMKAAHGSDDHHRGGGAGPDDMAASAGVGMVVNDVSQLSNSRIADEMKRLADPRYQVPDGVRPRLDDATGEEKDDHDEDDDDDAFGIGELLKRGKRPRQ